MLLYWSHTQSRDQLVNKERQTHSSTAACHSESGPAPSENWQISRPITACGGGGAPLVLPEVESCLRPLCVPTFLRCEFVDVKLGTRTRAGPAGPEHAALLLGTYLLTVSELSLSLVTLRVSVFFGEPPPPPCCSHTDASPLTRPPLRAPFPALGGSPAPLFSLSRRTKSKRQRRQSVGMKGWKRNRPAQRIRENPRTDQSSCRTPVFHF